MRRWTTESSNAPATVLSSSVLDSRNRHTAESAREVAESRGRISASESRLAISGATLGVMVDSRLSSTSLRGERSRRGSSTTCLMRVRFHVYVMCTRLSAVWMTAGYEYSPAADSSVIGGLHVTPLLDNDTESGVRPLVEWL